MVACLTAYFKHVSGRTLGFIDGALSSYSALGIYLFPYLSLHKPLLLIVFLLTAAIVLYECLFIYIDVQILHATWHAINYAACLCAFIMLLCSAGYIPLTSSDITLAVGESDTLETNGDFILVNLMNNGGAEIPKPYKVTVLTGSSLTYKDDFGTSHSFTKIKQ
jgi:hypothetical protein